MTCKDCIFNEICHNPYDETEKETIERDYCSDGERRKENVFCQEKEV